VRGGGEENGDVAVVGVCGVAALMWLDLWDMAQGEEIRWLQQMDQWRRTHKKRKTQKQRKIQK
jgi:hypothetical protein